MANYYVDYEIGSNGNAGTGVWRVQYTGGSGTQPVVGSTFTGGTSGVTFWLSAITVTSGTWVGTTAAGQLSFSAKSGTETSGEQLNNSNGSHCHITGTTAIEAKRSVYSGWSTPVAGDTVYVVKSAAPVKFSGATGQATWTSGSKTVTAAEHKLKIFVCVKVTGLLLTLPQPQYRE
jgi:hypothetical protein